MTAVVILNVMGAILIVTAIVSLLAWAVVRDRGATPTAAAAPAHPRRTMALRPGMTNSSAKVRRHQAPGRRSVVGAS
jgi:hypothetical protein